MSRIDNIFKSGKKALIPYVTAGYPGVDATLKVVPVLADRGADIIELGIPFSDPLADGATIQKASFAALQSGVTPRICLDIAMRLREKISTPLVFMSYFNPIFSYGIEEFCQACARCGVDGLIIPDLPPEEGSGLEEATRQRGLDLIYLLAPTSTDERIRMVAARSRGFIYLVSVTGVTGSRSQLPVDLGRFVSRVRHAAARPLCVGFGISTPEQARQVARIADGVIVGSRVIQLMEADSSFSQAGNFIKELRTALDEPAPK